MTNIPTVSVVLTVYNRARFAAEAIDSILAQTLADFELIIVDDGSTDNSPNVIADYAERDSRVIVVSQKNAGLAAARNVGAKTARAELVAFMDDDDHSPPTRLQKQVAFLRANPQTDCCTPWMSQMDKSGKQIRAACPPIPLPSFFVESDSPVHHIGPRVMIRRRTFEEVGGFREYCRIAEDLDFALRFWESRRALGIVAEDLYRWRTYRGTARSNLTGGFPLREFKYIAAVLISAHCRRLGKDDPIEKNMLLDKIMESLAELSEEARVYLMRYARNCARRILREPADKGGASHAEFWEIVGYIREMSSGLEQRANAVLRWLLWQSLRYGRFSVAARLSQNFAVRI